MTALQGPIEPGDEVADRIGFLKSLFEGYLFMDGQQVYISVIRSLHPRQGHLQSFVNALLQSGFTVKIPTPFLGMKFFLLKNGFKKTVEFDERFDADIEVWVKESE